MSHRASPSTTILYRSRLLPRHNATAYVSQNDNVTATVPQVQTYVKGPTARLAFSTNSSNWPFTS